MTGFGKPFRILYKKIDTVKIKAKMPHANKKNH